MTVPPVLPAGVDPSEWSIAPVQGLSAQDSTTNATSPTDGGGFGNVLSNAIDSLQQSQDTAATAAQGIATGTVTDPQQAIVDVENAQLAMQLASQIRDKTVESVQGLFQMQV